MFGEAARSAMGYLTRTLIRRRLRPVLWRIADGRVLAGPFRGMQYVPRAHGSEWAPKLLGTYECEIAPAIEEALTRKPRLFVNIGGGEGYYAVGLALRSPGVETVCFESSRRGRSMIRRLADHNDVVDRLRVFGTCNREALAATLSHGSRVFVLCDVEGAEWELLDPVAIPSLREADVLVELHEFRRPGVG